MTEPAVFLRRKAEEVRALAARTPEIASELRRLAEWIDTEADRLLGLRGSKSES